MIGGNRPFWSEGDEESVGTSGSGSIGSLRSAGRSGRLRNLSFVVGSVVAVLTVCFVGTARQYAATQQHTTQSFVAFASGGGATKDGVPTTIYQFDSESVRAGHKTRKLPYVWHQVWETAGWRPQKLYVSRHASEYTDVLTQVEQSENLTPQQKRHIYKYLAMASVGGGWLAHADVMPLQPFYGTSLPHGGKFTLYDGVHSEPCFLSGSASEWLRIGKLLAQHASSHRSREDDDGGVGGGVGGDGNSISSEGNDSGSDESNVPDVRDVSGGAVLEWNERDALQELRDEFVVQSEVFTVKSTSNSTWVWNSQDCRLTHQQRVVHFDLEGVGVEDPGDRVVKWMSMWLQACERSDYFLKQDYEHSHKTGRVLTRQEMVDPVGSEVVETMHDHQLGHGHDHGQERDGQESSSSSSSSSGVDVVGGTLVEGTITTTATSLSSSSSSLSSLTSGEAESGVMGSVEEMRSLKQNVMDVEEQTHVSWTPATEESEQDIHIRNMKSSMDSSSVSGGKDTSGAASASTSTSTADMGMSHMTVQQEHSHQVGRKLVPLRNSKRSIEITTTVVEPIDETDTTTNKDTNTNINMDTDMDQHIEKNTPVGSERGLSTGYHHDDDDDSKAKMMLDRALVGIFPKTSHAGGDVSVGGVPPMSERVRRRAQRVKDEVSLGEGSGLMTGMKDMVGGTMGHSLGSTTATATATSTVPRTLVGQSSDGSQSQAETTFVTTVLLDGE